jgi:hypothetical protein
MIFRKKKQKEVDDLKTLWLKHREEFLKIYANEIPQGDKLTLEKALVDLDGKVYYRFTGSSTIMPLERMGKMQDFLTMMSAGLDATELEALIDIANNELALALAGKKADVLKIGAVLNQIKERQSMILHDQLLWQFMAVQLVREDEPASQFVQKIHDEKIEALQLLYYKNDDYSFFHNPELKLLSDLLRSSQEDLQMLLMNSIREREILKKKISLLRGGKGLGKGKKTNAPTL